MIRRPPRSTLDRSSAASDVYKRQSRDRLAPFALYKTERRDEPAVRDAMKPGLVRRAVARGDAFFLGVLRRVLLDLGAHQLAIGLHPVGDHLPLRAVPLLELHQSRAFMVEARHLERRHQAGGAQRLQAR